MCHMGSWSTKQKASTCTLTEQLRQRTFFWADSSNGTPAGSGFQMPAYMLDSQRMSFNRRCRGVRKLFAGTKGQMAHLLLRVLAHAIFQCCHGPVTSRIGYH